jgi:hypothetical protein
MLDPAFLIKTFKDIYEALDCLDFRISVLKVCASSALSASIPFTTKA